MWKIFLFTSLRNLKRNLSFSILNIGGLALGMAACIVMLLFIRYEKSFDHLHKKGNQIYRLTEVQRFDGTPEQNVSLSMYPMAEALQKDYPEVINTVRVNQFQYENFTVRKGQKQITLSQVLACDSNFFQVFDFTLLEGNRNTALDAPNKIVITASTAEKLFGRTDVAGETIEAYQDGGFKSFIISAVANDVPENSHIRFDGLLSIRSMQKQGWMDGWDSNWLYTYLVLDKKADVKKLQAAMPSFLNTYLKEGDAKHYELNLQPLYDVHLGSENITHDDLNYKKFSNSYVKIFLVIALFVLLIAVLNFVNLSTARAAKRAKEVGIRKTIGAGHWQLVRQFVSESILFSFFATVLATSIVWLTLPLVNSIINRDIHFDLFNEGKLFFGLLALAMGVGILSGIYPSIFMASYQPVKVLKGIIRSPIHSKWSLRNVLVVSQFSIAIILIVCTLLIVQQLNFVKNKDIGFDKDWILTLKMNQTANKKFETLKAELVKNKNIMAVTGYNQRLGNNISQMGANYINDRGENKHLALSHLVVDYDYLQLFNIKLIKGRNFSKDMQDDQGRSYIINETLANQLETKQPVGTEYSAAWLKQMGHVIGVVKDFNFNSLHSKIAPLYISIMGWDYTEIAVKIKPGNVTQDINYIKDKWQSLVTDMPFSYSFLDDHMNSMYDTDQRAGKVVTILTVLAIIIACLGLFGIALFNIQTKTKEIGIRRVLGAGVGNITGLLSKEFLKPVLIALLIAVPVAWWAMNKWLEDFAYRIHISWIVFVAAGCIALVLALVTISFQTIRAAIANPVMSLRTE